MPMPDAYAGNLAGFFDQQAREGNMLEFDGAELDVVRELEGHWALEKGMRVLEPGCGSGRLTERLAQAVGPGGRVVGLDISEEYITLARERLKPFPWAVVEKGDVYALDTTAGEFDAVVCFNAFPHFTRPREVLEKMRKVLEPGGRLFISHSLSRAQVNDVHRKAHCVKDHLLPEPVGLVELCDEAGFEVVEIVDSERFFHLGAKFIL